MVRLSSETLIVLIVLLASAPSSLVAQQDTSSFFPRGLWGIWIIGGLDSPWPPHTLSDAQWSQERTNWTGVNANYMINFMPYTVLNTIMDFADDNGYKIDINPGKFWNQGLEEYGLPALVTQLRGESTFPSGWKDTVDARINFIKSTYGGNQSMHSYYVAHENDIWGADSGNQHYAQDTSHWKGISYVLDQIKELDADHKSYIVNWGTRRRPMFPFGLPLDSFARRFPTLGIYQVDDYVFLQSVGRDSASQQSALDSLLVSYNDCMRSFRDRSTEWHAVIQTQREYSDTVGTVRIRRPDLYEVKVQAYLALSRGARGITQFVYGSNTWTTGGASPVAQPSPQNSSGALLLGCKASSSIPPYYDGLVVRVGLDSLRMPFPATTDIDGISAFDNVASMFDGLRPIESILRKLRVYDAFPNSGTLSANAAHITSVGGVRMEVGVFKRVDEGMDSTAYFMLVNRVCNDGSGSPAAAQISTVVFSHPTFSCLEITEVSSSRQWVISATGSFTDTLQPGSGKLYRLKEGNLSELASEGRSVSISAIAPGSQRKLYRETSGKLHEVFESGGEIFYRNSTDGGSSWAVTTRLTDGAGSQTAPCIAMTGSTVLVAWQGGDDTYRIRLRRSTNGGSSWLSVQNLTGEEVDCIDPGPLPSVAGYSDGSAFIAYRDQTEEQIRCKRSTDAGASWTTIGGAPSTNLGSNMPSSAIYTTPSSTIQANMAHVNGAPGASAVYYNYYDFSTSSWGSATNLSSVLPGQYEDHANSCLSQSSNFRTIHVVWDAEDTWSESRVIVHREGSFRSFGSTYSVLQYQTESKPSVAGTLDEEAWVVYQNASGIWKQWYDGSSWDSRSFIGSGYDPQTSTGSGYTKYMWTSGSASPYQVNVGSETLSKTGEVPIYSRALNVMDTAKGTSASLELGRIQFVRSSGSRESIPLVRVESDTLDRPALFDAQATVGFILPEDADTLLVQCAIYGVKPQDLLATPEGGVILTLKDATTGVTLAGLDSIGSGSIVDGRKVWEERIVPLQSVRAHLKGTLVRIRPEFTGLPEAPLLVSLGHIYRSASGTMVQKGLPGSPTTRAETEPIRFGLDQSYPNPFNPATTLRYQIAAPGMVHLCVYDVLGREVVTLVNGENAKGVYSVQWNASRHSSGVYIARLTVTGEAGSTIFSSTRKILLTK